MGSDISETLNFRAVMVDDALAKYLPNGSINEPALQKLHEAIRHGALNGGKRLRPFLVIEAAVLCGASADEALPAAAAIEMVHAYSLIHDDLPAMDDADTRRGKPSVHKAFGEDVAILAGDALLTDAFAVIAAEAAYPADATVRLVRELAMAAGSAGMVGGQMMDLHPGSLSEAEIVGIQRRKTGALIEAAAVMGGHVAGAETQTIDALRAYARALGEAFQVVDDILDETATAETLGKPAGADAAAGKATFVSLDGLEGARARVAGLTAEACAALAPFGDRAKVLKALAEDLAKRSH